MAITELDYFLDDEGRIVSFHQLRNVYHLVVSELEDQMMPQKISKTGVVHLQVYSYVKNEASCHCSTLVVDTYDLLDVGPGINWHENSVFVFCIAERGILHYEFVRVILWI